VGLPELSCRYVWEDLHSAHFSLFCSGSLLPSRNQLLRSHGAHTDALFWHRHLWIVAQLLRRCAVTTTLQAEQAIHCPCPWRSCRFRALSEAYVLEPLFSVIWCCPAWYQCHLQSKRFSGIHKHSWWIYDWDGVHPDWLRFGYPLPWVLRYWCPWCTVTYCGQVLCSCRS